MPFSQDEVRLRFTCDTKPVEQGLTRLSREVASFSAAISGAFRTAVSGGRAFEDVLKELALRIATIAFDAATRPIASAIGNALGGMTAAFAPRGATEMSVMLASTDPGVLGGRMSRRARIFAARCRRCSDGRHTCGIVVDGLGHHRGSAPAVKPQDG